MKIYNEKENIGLKRNTKYTVWEEHQEILSWSLSLHEMEYKEWFPLNERSVVKTPSS